MRRLASPRMMALRPCTGVRIRCHEGHVPLTTLSRRVIAAHSRLPQAHWHRNQAADLAAASCEMASCHIASSHSMHEVPSPHASAPTGTTHTNTRPATLSICLGARFMTCKVDAEAASRQLHAEHLHPMSSGAGARRTSVTASAASLPAILRGLASSHHHRPPLRATAGSECQGGELPMGP